MWHDATEAFLLVAIASTLGIFGGVAQCYEFYRCDHSRTCSNTSSRALSCSFVNSVTIAGDVLYGSVQDGSHATLTRGVCAPGERMHLNSLTHALECAPWRAWPDALNEEIMSPGASAMHDQMCGAWLDAGPTAPLRTTYWSFYDQTAANAAVVASDVASFSSSRLASGDLGKLFASCQHTVLGGSGAIRASAVVAYHHLKLGLANLTTNRRVLEGVGFLAGHYCDGSVLIGTTVDAGIFKAVAYPGSSFSTGALAEALFAVEEGIGLQNLAEEGNRLINLYAYNSPVISFEELEYVYEGATGRTDHASVPLLYDITPELDGVKWLLDNGHADKAAAYLHGQAAMCSFALQGSLDVQAAGEWSARGRDLRRIRAARPRAAALGRLAARNAPQNMADPDALEIGQASTVTFSQLQALPRGDARADCAALARFLFPDRLDNLHFDSTVTPTLHQRLETLAEELRAAVIRVVTTNAAISATMNDPAAVAAAVAATRIRLAGAPRGTWGGIARGYTDGLLESDDGPMLIALKQARAIFNDRVSILFDDRNVCSGPPIFDALDANAYIYPGGECTHTLLGILRAPFADERYDNVSLATRVGYIFAHELAHNTLVTTFNTAAYSALLHRYMPNNYDEAIADLIGVLAVIDAGHATATQVCQHVSQLWCARVPLTWAPSTETAHPGPNERGDLLCATLQDLGML
jgi:hypothetical protein